MRNLKEYFRPSSPDEALAVKSEYGTTGAYLAGGSDLLVHRSPELVAVIDIRHLGLNAVGTEGDEVVIGGAATLRDAEDRVADVAGGMLRTAFRETAPWLIRNAATVAGNLANASPAADAVPALLALDTELVLLGPSGGERVPAADILDGPHATRLDGRLICELRVPATARTRRAAFIKHARSKSDIAQLNVAVSYVPDGDVMRDVRIVLGAVAPTAVRASRAEAIAEGARLEDGVLHEVALAVEADVRPIDDWRASAAYRRRMSGVLTRRALLQARDSAGKEVVR